MSPWSKRSFFAGRLPAISIEIVDHAGGAEWGVGRRFCGGV